MHKALWRSAGVTEFHISCEEEEHQAKLECEQMVPDPHTRFLTYVAVLVLLVPLCFTIMAAIGIRHLRKASGPCGLLHRSQIGLLTMFGTGFAWVALELLMRWLAYRYTFTWIQHAASLMSFGTIFVWPCMFVAALLLSPSLYSFWDFAWCPFNIARIWEFW